LEVGTSPGTGKLRIAGGIEGPMKESIQRAFGYLRSCKGILGIAQAFDTTDFHVEAIDLLTNRTPCEAGVGLVVAIYSALKKHAVQPALLIIGDLSIQGHIKPARSIAETLQIGMENGAKRALIPLDNKRHFLEVSGDVLEKVDPIFFADPLTASIKALGIS
jgi:ATP-dependent Lon protease